MILKRPDLDRRRAAWEATPAGRALTSIGFQWEDRAGGFDAAVAVDPETRITFAIYMGDGNAPDLLTDSVTLDATEDGESESEELLDDCPLAFLLADLQRYLAENQDCEAVDILRGYIYGPHPRDDRHPYAADPRRFER